MGSSQAKSEFGQVLEKVLQGESEEWNDWERLIKEIQSLDEIQASLGPDQVEALLQEHRLNAIDLLRVTTTVLQVIPVLPTQEVLNAVQILGLLFTRLSTKPLVTELLWEQGLPLIILNGVLQFLFTHGLTITTTSQENRYHLDPTRVWSRGVLMLEPHSVPTAYYEHRKLGIHCLLALGSGILFKTFRESVSFVDPWLWLLGSFQVKHLEDLFYSLLDTSLAYIGEGYIPYSGYFYEGEENYTQDCIQLLLVCVGHQPPKEIVGELEYAYKTIEAVKSKNEGVFVNGFRECISALNDKVQFEYVIRNLARLLGVYVKNYFEVFGSRVKYVDYHAELLMLFWYFIDLNQGFKSYVCVSDYINTIIDYLMINLINCAEDSTRLLGTLQLNLYVLFHLSSNREFALRFASAVRNPFLGRDENYLDCVLKITYTVITKLPQLRTLFSRFLSVLVNLAPFVRKLNLRGSQKLYNLFEYMSSPQFLGAQASNYFLLKSVIVVINTRLEYYWDGSIHLVYYLLSNKRFYERLMTKIPVPVESGASTWEELLPLKVLKVFYEEMSQRVDELIDQEGASTEEEVMKLLRQMTMVGVFPVPQPIQTRNYQEFPETCAWFRSFLWGLIVTKFQHQELFHLQALQLFKLSLES